MDRENYFAIWGFRFEDGVLEEEVLCLPCKNTLDLKKNTLDSKIKYTLFNISILH